MATVTAFSWRISDSGPLWPFGRGNSEEKPMDLGLSRAQILSDTPTYSKTKMSKDGDRSGIFGNDGTIEKNPAMMDSPLIARLDVSDLHLKPWDSKHSFRQFCPDRYTVGRTVDKETCRVSINTVREPSHIVKKYSKFVHNHPILGAII